MIYWRLTSRDFAMMASIRRPSDRAPYIVEADACIALCPAPLVMAQPPLSTGDYMGKTERLLSVARACWHRTTTTVRHQYVDQGVTVPGGTRTHRGRHDRKSSR